MRELHGDEMKAVLTLVDTTLGQQYELMSVDNLSQVTAMPVAAVETAVAHVALEHMLARMDNSAAALRSFSESIINLAKNIRELAEETGNDIARPNKY